MRTIDIIQKKRAGDTLTQEEISFMVNGFTNNQIPDYQMSAFLMACYFKPPAFKETLFLTEAMLKSGKTFDFSDLPFPKIDKHSTGGVGDKTSLILAPIVACYDIYIPMISGRGLGHTGGTVDKLESISGLSMSLTLEKFRENLVKHHVAMMGQTQEIAPADAKIYALRDVTGTVECIPLITASIMSKKLAEGIDGLVLDVKFGHGAFMQKFKDAVELAQWMVKIGKAFNTKTVALLTDMNQPLGNKIGHSLEIDESMDVLKGNGPKDVTDLSLTLSAHMLRLGKVAKTVKEGYALSQKVIQNGKALEKFKNLIQSNGGSLESLEKLPQASKEIDFLSEKSGFVSEIQARSIGIAASHMGCGRMTVQDTIDYGAGFILHKKVGDAVQKGEPLLTLKTNNEKTLSTVMAELRKAYSIEKRRPKPQPLVRKVIL